LANDELDVTLEHLQQREQLIVQDRIQTNPKAVGFGILSTDGINRDRPFEPEEEPALLAYLRKL
jgi:hypothetical protein